MFNTLPENKHLGKVTEFDGVYGKIITTNNEFHFFYHDIIGELIVETGDYVEFRAETLSVENKTINVARFVFVHQKNNIIQMPKPSK